MYYCDSCDYKTDDKGNFSHHNKTKKHLSKLDQIKIQSFEKIKEENDELKQKLFEKEKEKLEEVNKILKKQTSKTINNTKNSNNTLNNNVSIGSINYVNQHFKDAPPLEKITNFVINGININDINDASQQEKFINDIIYYHKHKILHQIIGDHIVNIYKKPKASDQSFHATDTSRLNYVVRMNENTNDLSEQDNIINSDSENDNCLDDDTLDDDTKKLIQIKKQYDQQKKKIEKNKQLQIVKTTKLKNNKKIWTIDKNGYKLCQLLINPIISNIVNILKKNLTNKSKKKIKDENIYNELKFSEAISNILENIDTMKLKNDINKYIAPKFNLDKK